MACGMTDPSSDKRFALKFRQWEKVSEELRNAERGQSVWCRLRRREAGLEDIRAEADMLCEELGLIQLGHKWSAIDAYGAENLLVRILGKSLITDYWLMEGMQARAFAEHIFDTFQMPRQYLTNVLSYDEGGITSWTPITDTTFDASVVVMDDQWVGIVAIGERG